MAKLLYIDTETTGLDSFKHGIIQFAYIIEIDGRVAKRGSYRINPFKYKRPREVTPKALEVNGYKVEDFPSYQDPKEAADDFWQVLDRYINKFDRDDHFTFVAYNSRFDMAFMQRLMEESARGYWPQYVSYKDLDVFALVKYLAIVGKLEMGNRHRLIDACHAVGLEFDAHDAIADIEATRDLHLRLIEEYLK